MFCLTIKLVVIKNLTYIFTNSSILWFFFASMIDHKCEEEPENELRDLWK